MTNEQRHPGEPGDPVVSKASRELSVERTPPHLDHVVLNEARRAARPRFLRSISWLRPAAWVTTIGLSLAIVLEVADMVPEPAEDPAQATEAEAPARAKKDSPPRQEADIEGKRSAMTESAEKLESAAERRIDAGRIEAEQVPAATPPVVEELQAEQDPAVLPEPRPAAIEVETVDQDRLRMLREAENRARLQSGTTEDSAARFPQVAPAAGVASKALPQRYCDEAATGSPDTWLECIVELEEQGLIEAARVERELLAVAFPDAESR